MDNDTHLSFYACNAKECCICCENKRIPQKNGIDLTLNDLNLEEFPDGILSDDILFLSVCKEHYLCVQCIRKIIHNYENHPINDQRSHFACPYPFISCETSIGFPNIFDHNLIKKVCRTETEWNNYITYVNQYAFPGFTIYKCLFEVSVPGPNGEYIRNPCDADILIENEALRTLAIGDLIVQCTQKCGKRFCYYCKQLIPTYNNDCFECKTTYENEHPNGFNYYFNKYTNPLQEHKPVSQSERSQEENQEFSFNECDYLYMNCELTVEIAVHQIYSTFLNVEYFMICPICKMSLYKTEKCNGLSHHQIERCYACGRIGFRVKGLGDHWNTHGVGGCYRFDYDSFVRSFVPSYLCNDNVCSNYDKGDCKLPEHEEGVTKLAEVRKKSYIYHMLKSLPSRIRFQVYDTLYKEHIDIVSMLPYKQTLLIIDSKGYRTRFKDFCEEIVYDQLQCDSPDEIEEFVDKTYNISADDFIEKYKIKQPEKVQPVVPSITIESDISAWRRNLRITNNEADFNSNTVQTYEDTITTPSSQDEDTQPLLSSSNEHIFRYVIRNGDPTSRTAESLFNIIQAQIQQENPGPSNYRYNRYSILVDEAEQSPSQEPQTHEEPPDTDMD